MTDREPFARVFNSTNLSSIEVGGILITHYDSPYQGNSVKDKINAAFNKRLDEELEKARKEWERGNKREREDK